jgi:hypothetical protein
MLKRKNRIPSGNKDEHYSYLIKTLGHSGICLLFVLDTINSLKERNSESDSYSSMEAHLLTFKNPKLGNKCNGLISEI